MNFQFPCKVISKSHESGVNGKWGEMKRYDYFTISVSQELESGDRFAAFCSQAGENFRFLVGSELYNAVAVDDHIEITIRTLK